MGRSEETAVLGSLLIDGSMIEEVSLILKERDFFSEQHKLIWRAMQSLTQDGKPIDVLTVASELRDHKCLTRAGGAAYISSLTDYVPDIANVCYYAKEVKKESASKDLVRVGNNLTDEGIPVTDRLEIGLNALSNLVQESTRSKEVRISEVMSKLMTDIEDGVDAIGGIKTGFSDLDKHLLGLSPGDFVVVGARPSVGKSAFALQVAANIAKQNKSVLYVSPEMTEDQLARRLLASESGVPYEKLLVPSSLTDSDKKKIIEQNQNIKRLPLIIDDSASQTLADVRVKARRVQARGGLDFIIVDYLQLLCPGDDSKEEVTKISKGLKALAKDLEIPVLGITQLSRNLEYRDDKRPRLSDIRATGQIEQDADIIMFLWYPEPTTPIVEIFIEKHRNGPLGAAKYTFNKDTTRFIPRGW